MIHFKGEKWHFRNDDAPARSLCGVSNPRLSRPLTDTGDNIECRQCAKLAVAARKKKLKCLLKQREDLLIQVENLSYRIRKIQ
jgi:hypothetical protein